jgi:ATP-dependent protease ClpP protease subunit
MTWQGPIAAPMANQIRDAFESRKRQATRFVFRLSSHGGSVAEGERVIEVLRQIKSTHELETVVTQGDVCASMCVFIYVQGQKRFGALTSSWLFHEVSHMDPVTRQTTKLDRAAWERLVDKYFRPAGVSEEWIADLKPRTIQSDYWQTGSDLIRSNSGIIHEPLANQTARVVVPGSHPRESASAQPSTGSPGECRKYFASIGAVVTVPCS